MECTDIKLREKRGCVQKQGAEIAYEHVKACGQHACNTAEVKYISHQTNLNILIKIILCHPIESAIVFISFCSKLKLIYFIICRS